MCVLQSVTFVFSAFWNVLKVNVYIETVKIIASLCSLVDGFECYLVANP